MEFFEGLDVELVFAFDVFDVFFHFEEVGCKGRPALGLKNGPEPDTTGVYADSSDKGPEGMPLRQLVWSTRVSNSKTYLYHRQLLFGAF